MESKVAKNEENEETKYEEVKTFQEVEPIKKEIRTDSYFDGSLIELIGWKLLGLIIIGVTFGIATPWAKCMLYSYQIKHTVYNGKRLKFEGTGGDLFVNMFKWLLLTIITFGIYAFFVPVKKTKWVISNIHFEDEEFVRNESFFDGKTIQLIGVNILCRLLNIISFGLLYPFTVCYRLKWINKHTVINRKKLAFNGRAICLFGKYILWCFLTLITFGIYGLWLPIKMLKWQTKSTHIKTVGEVEEKDKSLFIAIPIAIIAIIIISLLLPGAIDIANKNNDISDFMDDISHNLNLDNISKRNSSKTSAPGEQMIQMYNDNDSDSDSISSNKRTSGYPIAKDISGQYRAKITEKQYVDGEYDDSKTKESTKNITIKYENGKIKYDDYSMQYDSELGYAYEVNNEATAEAYFYYSGDNIKAEMSININKDNYTKQVSISGTK